MDSRERMPTALRFYDYMPAVFHEFNQARSGRKGASR